MKAKNIKIALILGIAPLFMIGCAGTSGVGKLGAGSDSANVNVQRGAAIAQMSDAQEKQYQRQHRVINEELDLDAKKRDEANKSVNDTVSTVRNVAGTVFGLIKSVSGR